MKKKLAALFMLFALLISALPALETPSLSGRVNDMAGVFSASEIRALEQKLESLEASGAAQMAVLTVKSLGGDSLEEFSIRTVDKWKLGAEGKDNGVLLLLALEERKVRLEVGYGLEGELTDAKSGYIIREIIIPYFSKGDYASGMAAGIEAVASVAGGSADLVPASAPVRQSSSRRSVPVNFLVILFIIFFNSFGRMGRRRRGGLFSFLMLNSLLGGSRHRGGFGGGGFGSGGGGFGGGGFGGGGGGFGGGGASGGW